MPSVKIKNAKEYSEEGCDARGIEQLLSKHEALSSNFSAPPIKKKKKEY
jgi:hypothetical protein